jgi:hypothetical protein
VRSLTEPTLPISSGQVSGGATLTRSPKGPGKFHSPSLAETLKKLRLQLRMRPGAFGPQAEEIDRLGRFPDSLQTRRATSLEVVVDFLGSRIGKRPEQKQFVRVL